MLNTTHAPLFLMPLVGLFRERQHTIRSRVTNRLLASYDNDGLLLWEPRAKMQYLLTWEQLRGIMPKEEGKHGLATDESNKRAGV